MMNQQYKQGDRVLFWAKGDVRFGTVVDPIDHDGPAELYDLEDVKGRYWWEVSASVMKSLDVETMRQFLDSQDDKAPEKEAPEKKAPEKPFPKFMKGFNSEVVVWMEKPKCGCVIVGGVVNRQGEWREDWSMENFTDYEGEISYKEKELPYPKIMKNTNDGTLVLMIERSRGVVVSAAGTVWCTGRYSDAWNPDAFVDFHGEIIRK